MLIIPEKLWTCSIIEITMFQGQMWANRSDLFMPNSCKCLPNRLHQVFAKLQMCKDAANSNWLAVISITGDYFDEYQNLGFYLNTAFIYDLFIQFVTKINQGIWKTNKILFKFKLFWIRVQFFRCKYSTGDGFPSVPVF